MTPFTGLHRLPKVFGMWLFPNTKSTFILEINTIYYWLGFKVQGTII
jgi:hypothetical protein